MARTLLIRNVDDETFAALATRAARSHTTVPELVRRHLLRLARRPGAPDWLTAVQRPAVQSNVDAVSGLDVQRGEWPDARR